MLILSPRLTQNFLYKVHPNTAVPASITSQLIWREYFYCMSVNNPTYNRMKENPICLNIDWYDDENQFQQWKTVILFANFEKDCHLNLKNKFYKMSHSHLAVCTSPDNFTLKSLHLLSERQALLLFITVGGHARFAGSVILYSAPSRLKAAGSNDIVATKSFKRSYYRVWCLISNSFLQTIQQLLTV